MDKQKKVIKEFDELTICSLTYDSIEAASDDLSLKVIISRKFLEEKMQASGIAEKVHIGDILKITISGIKD
jgi:hypothetical protein